MVKHPSCTDFLPGLLYTIMATEPSNLHVVVLNEICHRRITIADSHPNIVPASGIDFGKGMLAGLILADYVHHLTLLGHPIPSSEEHSKIMDIVNSKVNAFFLKNCNYDQVV